MLPVLAKNCYMEKAIPRVGVSGAVLILKGIPQDRNHEKMLMSGSLEQINKLLLATASISSNRSRLIITNADQAT